MTSVSDLPIILVSARSKQDASNIISELVDNEPEEWKNEDCVVWRLVNKYYSADVRLLRDTDDAPVAAPVARAAEAHVVYLAPDECTAEAAEAAERRAARAEGADVRVLAAGAARLSPALAAWAARRRYEPVALRERAAREAERAAREAERAAREAEPAGAAAARAALHAHAWPGLRRAGEPACAVRPPRHGDDSSDGSGRSSPAADEEAWTSTLQSARAATARVRGLAGAERRAGAEALVAQFARALGYRLDSL